MKTKISKLGYGLAIIIAFVITSCEGERGQTGPAGNSNVLVIRLLKADINWTVGSYLGRPSNIFTLTTDSVSQDIIDHGTVLGYYSLDNVWFALPLIWENSGGTNRQYVFHAYVLNSISLYAYSTSGVLDPGAISEYRFLLITDNTVIKKSTSNIISDLTRSGVDIYNYYEVMDFYGLGY